MDRVAGADVKNQSFTFHSEHCTMLTRLQEIGVRYPGADYG